MDAIEIIEHKTGILENTISDFNKGIVPNNNTMVDGKSYLKKNEHNIMRRIKIIKSISYYMLLISFLLIL